MKKIYLLKALFLCYLLVIAPGCLFYYLDTNGTFKEALSETQIAAIKYLSATLNEKIVVQMQIMLKDGFVFTLKNVEMLAVGNVGKNDLVIMISVRPIGIGPDQEPKLIERKLKKCPKVESQEMEALVDYLIKVVIRELIVSPYGTPI